MSDGNSPQQELVSVKEQLSEIGIAAHFADAALQIPLNETFEFILTPTDSGISVVFGNIDEIEGLVSESPRTVSLSQFPEWAESLYNLLSGSYLHRNTEMTDASILMSYDSENDVFYTYNRSHRINTIPADSVSLDELHWYTQNVWGSEFEVRRPNGNPDLSDFVTQESVQAITIREQDHYSTVYNYIFESVVLVVFYDPVGDVPQIGLKPIPSKSMILPTIRTAEEVVSLSSEFEGTHKLIAENI